MPDSVAMCGGLLVVIGGPVVDTLICHIMATSLTGIGYLQSYPMFEQ